MRKVGRKILSLVIVAFLVLGAAPMTTYAAETTNQRASIQGTTALEADGVSVTTYPSAIKFTSKSEKDLFVKVKTTNGTSADGYDDDWIWVGTTGQEKVVAPLAGGTYVVSYCYANSNYEPDSANAVTNTVTVTEAEYEEGAYVSGEYIIDYKNGANIFVKSANDNENKAFYTYSKDSVIEDEAIWYAFPNAKTSKIVVTNSDPSITPNYFQSKESGTSGDLAGNKFSMSVTFRNVSITYVELGLGEDVVNIEGDVGAKNFVHSGNLEIVGDKNSTLTVTNTINAYNDLTIKNMKEVSIPDKGNISATTGMLELIGIDSLVKNGSGAVSGSTGVLFENVKNFVISSNYNTVYSTNGNVTFDNSFGVISTSFNTGKAISTGMIYFKYEKSYNVKMGADEANAVTINVNNNAINTSSYTIGKYLEIDGEFVGEVVAIPPTIDVETPGVIKIKKDPSSGVNYRVKIVDSNGVLIADWYDLLFDKGITEVSPLDGGEYTISYGYEDANYDLVESSIKTVSVTVKAIGYEESYEDGDEKLIIDYANVKDRITWGEDEDDLGYAILVYPSMNDAIESIDPSEDTIDYTLDAFAPKYYTYDGGKTWFRLPEAEIVVENSSTTVVPTVFGMVQVPVSNFDVTFRNLSVDGVMLGFGDAELTVEGNVVVGSIAQFGNLEIVGKGENATFKSYEVVALNEEIAETYGNITIKDMKEVSIGDRGDSENDPEYGSIMALNSINLSNVENFVVIAEDNALNAFYDINISNVNNVDITSLYGFGMYAFQGDVSINGGESLIIDAPVGIVALNVDIDGGNTLSIDIKAMENGIYAGQKYAYSSESENPEEYVIGELSIQNCKSVNVSGKEIENQSEEPDSYVEPVYIAIEGTDITINNVTALTIKGAVNGIVANNGNLSIDGGNTLYIDADEIGIHALNVYIQNIKDSIDIWAVSRGIMAAPSYSYINESENSEEGVVGVISIQDCGAVSISGNDYIMPTDEDATDVLKIVELAIAGLDIQIVNVESLTIKDAAVGILAEDGNVLLEDIADMNISAIEIGILCSVVELNDVLGTVVVSEDKGLSAVLAMEKIIVIHTKNISVVSRDEDGNEVVLERNAGDNTVTVDETHKYFAIVKAFTFDSFVEQVKNEDLPEFQANNETKESDIFDFIEGLVDETGEAGLTFEILSFDMEPAKDSTNGSIKLEVKFTYVEDGTTLTKTINTAIDISLRVYVAERFEEFEDAMANILGADITSDNKASFIEALDIANELLKDLNKAELTEEEMAKLNADYTFLNNSLTLYETVETLLKNLATEFAAIPADDKVTSANEVAISSALNHANELLSDEYVGNLTDAEEADVKAKKAALEAKLAIIKAVEDKIAAAEDAVSKLPADDKVTSTEKSAIENALAITNELLAKEGNLTAEEKAAVEAMKAALDKKLAIVKDVEDKIAAVEDTVSKLPADDKVTSDEKKSIEDALDIIDDLLGKDGNLTPAQKENIAAKKAPLESKLDKINETAKELAKIKEVGKLLPEDNKVKPSDIDAIKEALDKVNKFLASDVVDNLTAEEKAEVEALKAALEKKLAIPSKIADELAGFVEKEAALPKVDTITSDDKSAVEGLLNSINEFKNTYAGNLTDEQKAQVETLIANFEKRLNKIKELETKIDKIEDDVEAQPTYKDVTSENKEDIKDVIGNIDEVLANNKDNLSEEEIKALEEQKKELEDMVEFIEKIEKYEPVAGDFENTTDSEENDKKGNLVNKSEELITIIPLDKIEKQHVAKGEKVQVYLVVTDISETVSNDDKDLIDEAIGDKEVGAYIDLTLFKQIGDREASKVPNTNGMVQITVEVPAELLAANANVTGKYQIVRVHEGETTIIDTVFDEATGTITFETDKFSTYALVYEAENAENAQETPDTGDSTNAIPTVALLFVGIAMVVVARKRSLKTI